MTFIFFYSILILIINTILKVWLGGSIQKNGKVKVTEDKELTVNMFPNIFKYSLFPDFTKSQIFYGQYFRHMMCEINVYIMFLLLVK